MDAVNTIHVIKHESSSPGFWKTLAKYKTYYLFISPFFILFTIFGIYPAIYALVLSLHQWGGGIDTWKFVGLRNFQALWLADPVFIETAVVMFKYMVIIVPAMTLLSLVFAVLLNSREAKFLGNFYRSTLILPYVLAPTVISVVFYQLYDPIYGWINLLIGKFGLEHIRWLGDPDWSYIAISIVVLWQFLGYNALIALAGLTGVPSEIYDAAKVDGANSIQTFFLITIPMMRPILLFMAVMSTIGVFNMYAQPWLLTHGGPGYSSNTFSIMLYRNAFEFRSFGYASAIGVSIFVLTGIFSLLQIRLNRMEES